MSRKRWVVAAAAVVVAAAVLGGVLAASGGDEETAAAQESAADTVAVQKGDLSADVSESGTLTYRGRADGSPYPAINQAAGIYTELPEAGDRVGCGDAFYRVDDDPVLLLCGAVPAYRELEEGDHGADVRQLNRNLRRLGYDAEAGVEIDPGTDDFTWETEAALERLQDEVGLADTGALDLDEAIFLPGAVRIAKVAGELGGAARPGAAVAQATSDTLEVQVELDATEQGTVKEGDRAQITLPGNRSARGRVERLGRVARVPGGQSNDAGAATIPAYISLDDPAKARGLDQAPVQVEIRTKGVQDVLSVPVTALVGSAGGGYAVEVADGDGERRLVAVKLGLFDSAAGRVEVEGDLAAGDRVVVPST
jgi:peptidoglycan hydrolase-like protein with peptidoglycan-binding domain